MKYLTIKPLARFLSSQPRDYISMKELISLENQISKKINSLENLDKSSVGWLTQKNYLTLLSVLRKSFADKLSVKREVFCQRVDKWLRGQNLCYIRRENDLCSTHIFDPLEFSSLEYPNSGYDLCYYNEEAYGFCGHHPVKILKPEYLQQLTVKIENIINAPERPGGNNQAQAIVNIINSDLREKDPVIGWFNIFYIRCEEFSDTVLYGNLQIDLNSAKLQLTDKEIITKVMFRSNNLYCQMVQEALRHGLELGKERILFQAGQAAEFSQWPMNKDRFTAELITSENISFQNEIYKKEAAELEKLRPGDLFSYEGDKKGLVVKKRAGRPVFLNALSGLLLPTVFLTAHKYGYGDNEGTIMDTLNKIKALEFYASGKAGNGATTLTKLIPNEYRNEYGVSNNRSMIYKQHVLLYAYLSSYLISKEFEKALATINLIFSLVAEGDYSADHEAKLKALTTLFADYRDSGMEDNLYVFINEFLLKFNYHSALLSNFPKIQTITSNDGRQFFFHEKTPKQVFRPMKCPAINDFSFYSTNDYMMRPKLAILPRRRPTSWLYNWYECVLPEIFKTLGLMYKKTIISKKDNDKIYPAYAWEITTPLAELRQKSLIMF